LLQIRVDLNSDTHLQIVLATRYQRREKGGGKDTLINSFECTPLRLNTSFVYVIHCIRIIIGKHVTFS